MSALAGDCAIPHVPVSVGELLDKISILEVKAERIPEPSKQIHVTDELRVLNEVSQRLGLDRPDLATLRDALRRVNATLWNIEDAIRACERRGDFGGEFIRLARAVYRTNDERSALKRQINDLLGSRLVEEKSYAPY